MCSNIRPLHASYYGLPTLSVMGSHVTRVLNECSGKATDEDDE